jgi:hypothetical protein
MHTRLNLTYSMRLLSRYAHNLSQIHCFLIKRVFKYVVVILNIELRFSKKFQNVNNSYLNDSHSNDLVSYSDSDFVELKSKRHSINEYVFMLVDETISYSSK